MGGGTTIRETAWRGGRLRPARTRPSVSLSFGHHSHRRGFLLIVAACWLVGFFGLAAGRFSLVQVAVAGAGVAAWVVTGARRRRIENERERWIRRGLTPPPQAAHVRRIGDPRT